jgi:hypothetical protein
MAATITVKIKSGHGTGSISCQRPEWFCLDGIIIRGCKKKRSADDNYS